MCGGAEEAPGALPHTRQDKRRADKNTPPPLEGGGWGGGSLRAHPRPTPPPRPPPQGEGECQFSQLGAYPDAYGAKPPTLPPPHGTCITRPTTQAGGAARPRRL